MFATRMAVFALAALTLSLAGAPAAMAQGYEQSQLTLELQDDVTTCIPDIHVPFDPAHQFGTDCDSSTPDFGTDCFPSRRRDQDCDWGCEYRPSRGYHPQ